MIITVTMNPAIDKTMYLERLVPGELNRIQVSNTSIGGKGINVSRMLQVLGLPNEEQVAVGMTAGVPGQKIDLGLSEMGIPHRFYEVSGETRTNLKIIDKNAMLTEINEPGPEVRPEEVRGFLQHLVDTYAENGNIFILAGSVPRGVHDNVYQKLILQLRHRGCYVILDAEGELLRNGIKARPDCIKPNEAEFRYLMQNGESGSAGTARQTLEEQLQALHIPLVVVSRGGNGADFYVDGRLIHRSAAPVEVKSSVGAGDAMVASIAYARYKGLSAKEMMNLAIASSAAACTTEGTLPPEMSQIRQIMLLL